MKKKVAIISILLVMIITVIGLILNKNVAYNDFISKNFSHEFLIKSSQIQQEVREEILEKVFQSVNLEEQEINDMQISNKIEEQLLNRVRELEIYIEQVKVENLSEEDQTKFLDFRTKSIEDLKELYKLIDEYNEKIIQNKNITSNYYFQLQKELTSPIETINGYIMLNELKK